MKTYVPLNEGGKRAKERLWPVLDLWARYRKLRDAMTRMVDPYAVFPQEQNGAAVVWAQLREAERQLTDRMRDNERAIVTCATLTPIQLMVLTMRYVQGCDWPTVAERTGLERARLYQEHRIGLNRIGGDRSR